MIIKKILGIPVELPKLWEVLLIFLIAFLAYHRTLEMYIWQDDHATMFKLQHLSEGAGQFGTGIYDRNSAYRGIFVLLAPIYYIFGTDPQMYYLAGIIAYFLAAFAVYFLAKTLTRNKKIALASSLIFAAGFVGAETLWRITNSIHTSHTIIFLCLSLIVYKKFVDSLTSLSAKSWVLYLVSLLLFTYTIETGYIRAHGTILLILGMELLFNFKFPASLARVLPFIYVYYQFYLVGNKATYELPLLLTRIFINYEFNLLGVPLENLKNVFIPSILNIPLILFLFVMVFMLIWTKSRILLFLLILVVANYLVYFIHNPTQIFPSNHRYFSLSLVGFSIFSAAFFEKFFRKSRVFFLVVSLVVIFHLVLVNRQQERFVKDISIPGRKFYQSLKKEISFLGKSDAIFFDVRSDPQSSSEFASFFGVGSMPNTTAIAWHFNVDRWDFYMPDTFIELAGLLRDKKAHGDRIYTFFYDSQKGLVNTSEMTRRALFAKKEENFFRSPNEINLNYSSPLRASLLVSVGADFGEISPARSTDLELKDYLSYFESRDAYYKRARASAVSEWRYHEVRNLIDRDGETDWMGHRGHWHFEHYENVIIDLGRQVRVGAIKMKYLSPNLVPVDYYYLCSQDGKEWREIGRFNLVPDASRVVVDKVPSSFCRFLKMDIKKTVSDDSPQIAELEVIEASHLHLDLEKAEEVYTNPLRFVSNLGELESLGVYMAKSGIPAKACYLTDKLLNPDCLELVIYPGSRYYSIVIPTSGTLLRSINLMTWEGINSKIENVSTSFLSLSELEKIGYIVDYTEN